MTEELSAWLETECGPLLAFASKLQEKAPGVGVVLLPVGAEGQIRFYPFDATCFFVPSEKP